MFKSSKSSKRQSGTATRQSDRAAQPAPASVSAKQVAKGGKPVSNNRVDTLIGKQSELRGDIHFNGGLHVEGKVKGNVVANEDKDAVLSVSESGSIEGDVRVPTVVLNGTVTGDVHVTTRIQLSERARVTGNVYYKLIEMASGATVNGQLVHESAAPKRQEPSKPTLASSKSDSELVTERPAKVIQAKAS